MVRAPAGVELCRCGYILQNCYLWQLVKETKFLYKVDDPPEKVSRAYIAMPTGLPNCMDVWDEEF